MIVRNLLDVFRRTVEMELFQTGWYLVLISSLGVASQDPIELTDVRLYTEGGLLFGGAVEARTPNGWERVCYDSFSSRMGDAVCYKRGFGEGAMSVRPAASLGVAVTPLPSLACQFTMVDEEETIQCEYALSCTDHAVVVCNYPGYLGCYRHTRSNPSLDDAVFAHSNMTVQFCLSLCRQMDFPYAGLAFGQQCHCEAQGIDVLASRRLENEDCYLPCVGDPLQTCGGGTAVGIYDSRLGSCNEDYTDTDGAIASPGFPGKYSNNEECTWTVRLPDAVNITVHIHSVELYPGDRLSIATPSVSEYVIFTGRPGASNIRLESSGTDLLTGSQLVFTFRGNTVNVVFNSTLKSLGAQGVVLTFSFATGSPVDPPVQMNTTGTQTTDMTFNNTEPNAVTQSPVVTGPATDSSDFMTSTNLQTTRPTTAKTTHGYNGTFQSTATTGSSGSSIVIVEGASSTTPRSITMVNTGDDNSPSLAVVIAIAVGIILLILLTLTAVILFTTSRDHVRSRRHKADGAVISNAAYATTGDNDGQIDSGIYDPGYETADVAEPIYLSIRNDPRAKQTHREDWDNLESIASHLSLTRNASVKTAKTDHDYQSVDGLSRRNTEKSYISIYPDSKGSTYTDGRISPTQSRSDKCSIAEDGYMVPTPKNSTQIQLTKL